LVVLIRLTLIIWFLFGGFLCKYYRDLMACTNVMCFPMQKKERNGDGGREKR
jgi:hypothetical protein